MITALGWPRAHIYLPRQELLPPAALSWRKRSEERSVCCSSDLCWLNGCSTGQKNLIVWDICLVFLVLFWAEFDFCCIEVAEEMFIHRVKDLFPFSSTFSFIFYIFKLWHLTTPPYCANSQYNICQFFCQVCPRLLYQSVHSVHPRLPLTIFRLWEYL